MPKETQSTESIRRVVMDAGSGRMWIFSGPRVGGDLVEYALIVSAVALGTVAADKEVACALNTAYDRIALTVPAGQPAIPEPDECKAKCGPCDPPPGSGTRCYQPDSGHPHPKELGWDPHYHIWQRESEPEHVSVLLESNKMGQMAHISSLCWDYMSAIFILLGRVTEVRRDETRQLWV